MPRSVDKPIGCITRKHDGLARAAGAAHWYLTYEGPQVVFVSDDGRVFAMPDGSLMAEAWLAHRAPWLVGRYTQVNDRRNSTFAEMRTQIIADLRCRMAELAQARAA